MKILPSNILLLSLAFGLGSCTDSKFKGAVPVEPPPEKSLPIEVAVAEVIPPAPVPAPVVDELGSITDNHSVSLKVDVVFAIDTSASMDEEITNTQNNLQRMITTLNNGRIDSRIHLLLDVPLTVPAGTDPNKVAFVFQRVDSSDAISRLNNLFSGLYATSYRNLQNVPLAAPMAFRKDAKLEIVVISDDNGQGMGNLAVDFDPTKSLKATFNAIIGLPTSNVANGACDLAGIGSEFITLVTQSKGSSLDICSPDWSALITRLSTDMVKRSTSFPLSKKPVDAKALIVRIDGQKMADVDWSYDQQNNVITLIKTDAVKDGSKLDIIYRPMAS